MYAIVRRADPGVEGRGGVVESVRTERGSAGSIVETRQCRTYAKATAIKNSTHGYTRKSFASQLDQDKSPAPHLAGAS